MKRGLGYPYLRGTTWWIRYYHRGKEHRETSGSSVKADAVRLLRRRIAEIQAGRFGLDAERMTFEELSALLVADYKANGRKSLDRAERSIKHLAGHFGHARALDIPPKVGEYIVARHEAGAKNATIRLELAALKRMYNLAYRAERLPNRPYIGTVQVRNTRQGFFEDAALRAVIGYLPAHARRAVEFAYLTGWRRGEVVSLTWKQVDFDAGTIRLEPGTTKNDEGRTFPFSTFPTLARLLKAQREHTKALEVATARIIPWVFHRDGHKLGGFREAWANACKKAGVPGRLFHDLRRTAVRNLERAGVARSVAMKLTGHKTEAIYKRYAIVSESDLATAGARLESLHGEESERTRTNTGTNAGTR